MRIVKDVACCFVIVSCGCYLNGLIPRPLSAVTDGEVQGGSRLPLPAGRETLPGYCEDSLTSVTRAFPGARVPNTQVISRKAGSLDSAKGLIFQTIVNTTTPFAMASTDGSSQMTFGDAGASALPVAEERAQRVRLQDGLVKRCSGGQYDLVLPASLPRTNHVGVTSPQHFSQNQTRHCSRQWG